MKITFELFIHLSNEESKTGFLFKSQEHCRYGKSFRSEIIYIRKKKKKISRNKYARITISSGESP